MAAVLSRVLVTVHVAVRIYISSHEIFLPRWKVLCAQVYRWRPLLRPTHLAREQVDRYWVESDLYGRRLRSSDARHGGRNIHDVFSSSLVTYYVPRLLPVYRSPTVTDIDAVPYRLSARNFCKWHHMVFRGPVSTLLVGTEMSV